jgi:sigma-B regulation protein RsbU (phosphoserine phosphatase)
MKVHGSASIPVSATSGTMTVRLVPANALPLPGLAAAPPAGPSPARAEDPFSRVARLVSMVLGVPLASVAIAGEQPSWRHRLGAPDDAGGQNPAEQAWCRQVIGSQDKLIIDDARLAPYANGDGPASVIAWAGFPVRDPDGHVVGALCAADHLPRRWSAGDAEVLEALAHIASREVALQVALQHSAERAELAQTLQESLLPPRLPEIPGLDVAARYVAGRTGTEVLGDFFDVFPSVRGSWGIVVGDVCGQGVPAAKSTALARYTLFTDGITEARSHADRELYGEDRLRDCIAGLAGASATQMADAIQQAALAFSGEDCWDDTVALVLKIPSGAANGRSAGRQR